MPPKCDAICLVHLNGVSKAHAHGDRHVRLGLVRAPDVVVLHLVRDRHGDGFERRHVERRSDQRAFRARPVVAADVDDDRVVELAHVFHGLDHATDLVVGIGRIRGKDIRLADEELLFLGTERVPLRELRAAVFGLSVRPRRQLRVRRDHAEPLLIGEDLLAQCVPALVEQVHVADLLDPLRRRLVRRVRAAGGVIHEEGLIGRGGVQSLDVSYRVVRHAGDEVVAGVLDPRKDLRVIAEEPRPPLVGLAAHEAVEILEAHAARPLIERTHQAVFVARRVVVLAEPGRRVAVLLHDLADGRVVASDDGVVSRIARGLLGNHAESHGVMVASGEQRRSRRRAERGGVELRIAKAGLRNPVQRRRRDHTAERARDAVALVVRHDEQDVGRALGRHDARRPIRLRVLRVHVDHAAEPRRRVRNIPPVDGCLQRGRASASGSRRRTCSRCRTPGRPS